MMLHLFSITSILRKVHSPTCTTSLNKYENISDKRLGVDKIKIQSI
jgi:hypothetical protein